MEKYINGSKQLELVKSNGSYAIYRHINYGWRDFYPESDYIVAWLPRYDGNSVSWAQGYYDLTIEDALNKFNNC